MREMAKCYHWYKGKPKEKTNNIVTGGIDKWVQISKIGNIHRATISCILLDTICISLNKTHLCYYQLSSFLQFAEL